MPDSGRKKYLLQTNMTRMTNPAFISPKENQSGDETFQVNIRVPNGGLTTNGGSLDRSKDESHHNSREDIKSPPSEQFKIKSSPRFKEDHFSKSTDTRPKITETREEQHDPEFEMPELNVQVITEQPKLLISHMKPWKDSPRKSQRDKSSMNKDLPEYVAPAKKVKVELNIIGISKKKKQ